MTKVKVKNSTMTRLSGNILWFFLIVSSYLSAQNQMNIDWQQYPKAYVENMASEASREQILVQNAIKDLKADIKDLKTQRSKTKDANLKSELKKSIDDKEYALYLQQNDLKLKIIQSKKYRDMLSLSADDLKARLALDHPNTLTSGAARDTLKLDKTTEITHEAATEKKSPKTEVLLEESKGTRNVPGEIKPKEPLPNHEEANVKREKFDDWIPITPVNQTCNYQSISLEGNKAIQSELLFTYTPEEIKKHLRGTPYSKGTAFIGREPGYTYMQIDIEIASDLALQYYGNLSKSFIIVKLINGKEVRLINSRFDAGKIDPKKRTTTMSGMYYIDKNTEKVLATSELDTMRLNFTSGYEDYVIYNVDFFTRQLACLNAVK
jgi:hypothetical protein